MKELAELIQAVASLLWPVLTFVLIMIFGKEIRDIFKRIKRGKLFGQELELGESLDKLDRSAIAASTAKLPAPPVLEPANLQQRSAQVKLLSARSDDDEVVRLVLEQAELSPKLALITLAVEIEKELREIIFSQGELDNPHVFTIPNAIRILEKRGILPIETLSALRNFQRVRNQIVHSHEGASSDDILRAIDSGLIILRTLKSIPRQVNTVYHQGVEVFSDKDATQSIPNVLGLILDLKATGQDEPLRVIYPTTRTDYRKGMSVAWEWNSKRQWKAAWYRDPDSGEIKSAWGGSLEFVGSDLGDS